MWQYCFPCNNIRICTNSDYYGRPTLTNVSYQLYDFYYIDQMFNPFEIEFIHNSIILVYLNNLIE